MKLPQIEPLLAPRQVAAILQISPKTLRNWRSLGIGPTYRKYGRLARYDRQDVLHWMAQQALAAVSHQLPITQRGGRNDGAASDTGQDA